jgi:hypothetical protein
MDKKFCNLFVNGPNKKKREKFCIVKNKGRVDKKLEKCITKVVCMRLQATTLGIPCSRQIKN